MTKSKLPLPIDLLPPIPICESNLNGPSINETFVPSTKKYIPSTTFSFKGNLFPKILNSSSQ